MLLLIFYLKRIRFLDFFIKLYMFIQKRETVSAVFLFCNHLSADLREPEEFP